MCKKLLRQTLLGLLILGFATESQACGFLHYWRWCKYQHLKAYFEGGTYGGGGGSSSNNNDDNDDGDDPSLDGNNGNGNGNNGNGNGNGNNGNGKNGNGKNGNGKNGNGKNGNGENGDGENGDGGDDLLDPIVPGAKKTTQRPEAGAESDVFVGLISDDASWNQKLSDLTSAIDKLKGINSLHDTLQAVDQRVIGLELELRGDQTAPEGSFERMSQREILKQLLMQKSPAKAGTAKPRVTLP